MRGLRVEELAAEAGVSTALLYYHFKDRAGVLRRTLEFITDRADRYTAQAVIDTDDPRVELEQVLLLELQDTPEVRENSTAWGELRASAIFDADLREALRESTCRWVRETAEIIERAQGENLVSTRIEPIDAAERLTALVEGLSERWLSGSMTLDRARTLLRGGIANELGAT